MDKSAFFFLKQQTLYLRGEWVARNCAEIEHYLKTLVGFKIVDVSEIEGLDTFGGLLIERLKKNFSIEGENKKVSDLLDLLEQNAAVLPHPKKIGWFLRFSNLLEKKLLEYIFFLNFIGKLVIDFFSKTKDFEFRAFLKDIQTTGVSALPIVGVLSFLIGLVIAYQSATQLRQFGANIFIVDLVTISIVRELGPLIVAIIISGRSASSYTASIGLMRVQEEIDTLETMGVSPTTVLVVPRVLSLIVVTPLLIVFADCIGIFGGMIISQLTLNVSFTEFMDRASHVLTLKSFLSGVIKGPIFGIAIALIGTSEGFKVEQKAESIGTRVTASVVKSIFSVIVIDAAFSIVYRCLNI